MDKISIYGCPYDTDEDGNCGRRYCSFCKIDAPARRKIKTLEQIVKSDIAGLKEFKGYTLSTFTIIDIIVLLERIHELEESIERYNQLQSTITKMNNRERNYDLYDILS